MIEKFSYRQNERAQSALEAFQYNSIRSLTSYYDNANLKQKHISNAVLREEDLQQLIIADDDPYKLAIALAAVPGNKLSPMLSSKGILTEGYKDNNFSINTTDPKWYLCDLSEQRLTIAGEQKAVQLVNNSLLLKYHGRRAAFCLQSFSTRNGTFIAGNWYAPKNSRLIKQLQDQYDSGVGNLTLKNGVWSLMRSYQKGLGESGLNNDFIHEAEEIAANISETKDREKCYFEYY